MSIAVTPGSGATVAADQIGTAGAPATGQLLQWVKLDAGAAGASAPVAAATPLPVQHGNGTQTMPSGDAVGRSIFVSPSDGTNAFKSASAANLALKSAVNSQMVEAPGQWSVTHAPAVNTQATASQAAGGAGVRNVAQGLVVTLANDGTGTVQGNVLFNLRDGATGAGTILASFTLAVPATAGACQVLSLSCLNVPGTANTAMTLEIASAPAAHTAASVTLFGTTAV